MKQYRKKPIVVEATQWTGENTKEIFDFVVSYKRALSLEDGNGYVKLCITTLEGEMEANIGDYIIKGIAGEFYPCKKDIFLNTYEEVK